MSLLGKIFVVVVTILSIIFLGVQSALFYHSKDWRDAYVKLEELHKNEIDKREKTISELKGTITQVEKTRETLEANVAQLKDLNKSTEDRFQAKSEEFNKTRSDLETLQSTHKVVATSLDGKEKELSESRTRIDQLNQDLQKSLGEKETAEAQVARLIGQKAALEKDLAEVRKEYSDTKQKLLDMQLVMEELERLGVPVGTLVINHKPVPPINGKVAGVKADVTPALVVVTVGKDDKVEKGFQFTVYRGAEFVGKVVVEKVNADSSGCRVLFTAPGKVIKAGDDVATRLD
jgi:predicted  nucleic acid-binding Zn-ribbon protein